jgi:hypothetical protein
MRRVLGHAPDYLKKTHRLLAGGGSDAYAGTESRGGARRFLLAGSPILNLRFNLR